MIFKKQLFIFTILLNVSACVASAPEMREIERLKTFINGTILNGTVDELIPLIQQIRTKPHFKILSREANEFFEKAVLRNDSVERAQIILENNDIFKVTKLGYVMH